MFTYERLANSDMFHKTFKICRLGTKTSIYFIGKQGCSLFSQRWASYTREHKLLVFRGCWRLYIIFYYLGEKKCVFSIVSPLWAMNNHNKRSTRPPFWQHEILYGVFAYRVANEGGLTRAWPVSSVGIFPVFWWTAIAAISRDSPQYYERQISCFYC